MLLRKMCHGDRLISIGDCLVMFPRACYTRQTRARTMLIHSLDLKYFLRVYLISLKLYEVGLFFF